MPFGTPIGTKGRSAAAASIGTTGIAVTSGSTLSVMVGWTGAATFTSLADNAGNTYTIVGSDIPIDSGGTNHARMYRCDNCIGNASLVTTLTLSTSTSLFVSLIATPGAAVASFDQSNAATDAATPFASGAVTTTQPREMLIRFVVGNSGSNPATHAESSGTIVTAAQENDGTSFWTFSAATQLVTATGTYNSSWTESGGTSAAVFIVSLKEAPSGSIWKNAAGPGKHPGPRRFAPVPRGYPTVSAATSALDAAAVNYSVAPGLLTGDGALNASAIASTTAPALLTGAGALTGSAISAAIAKALVAGTAVGTASAVSTVTANALLAGSGALNGPSVAGTFSVGQLTGAGALQGAAVTTTTTAALLETLASPIFGTAISTAITPATLTGAGALLAASIAGTTAAGQLTASGALFGSAMAGAVVVGDIGTFDAGTMFGVSVSLAIAAGELITLTPPIVVVDTGGHGAHLNRQRNNVSQTRHISRHTESLLDQFSRNQPPAEVVDTQPRVEVPAVVPFEATAFTPEMFPASVNYTTEITAILAWLVIEESNG